MCKNYSCDTYCHYRYQSNSCIRRRQRIVKKSRKIGISNPEMDGVKVKIEVNEEAKG